MAAARVVAAPLQRQGIGKQAVLSSGMLLLVACSSGEPIHTASTNRSVPSENAFVLPPPGGPAIVGVIERRFANATQQDIALATNSAASGQNYLRARLFGPVEKSGAGMTGLSNRSIALTDVAAEMRTAMPGVAMSRSPFYVQNRYGPFGYAIGRKGRSDLCLYGWQNIRSAPGFGGNKGQIDIRLRLCQTGATEQQLMSVMYGYTISAFFSRRGWNPYGDPASPPEDLGKPGSEIRPLSETRYETVLSRQEEVVPVQRIRQPEIIAPPAVQPPPSGPRVPPPPAVSEPGVVVPPPSATNAR